jgi:trimethylamine--corrinoid protein Co-methyltransferase
MVLYTLRGIPVSDMHLSVDPINQVGPFKDFLSHRTTFDHRRSQSLPKLFNRKTRDHWINSGSKSLTEIAMDKAKWILENHKPIPLPESAVKRLREIVRRVEREKGLPESID